jgi:hypothetical protein
LLDILASDWVIMLYVIQQGKINRHTSGFVIRGHKGFSNSGKILEYYRRRWIHWFLPFFELSKITFDMSAGFPLKYKIKISYSLAKLNFQAILCSIIDEMKKTISLLS